MNVLFVCKHNRFRSKVGEALFNKYAGPMHKAKSAGVKLDPFFPYVASFVKDALKSHGVPSVVDAPTLISDNLISWADRIIIVADNVDVALFPRSKSEQWPVRDCDQDDKETINLRVREIDGQVRDLLHRLTKSLKAS